MHFCDEVTGKGFVWDGEGQVYSFVLYPCTDIARMLALVVFFKKFFFGSALVTSSAQR